MLPDEVMTVHGNSKKERNERNGEHSGVLQKVGWCDQKVDPGLHLFKKKRFGNKKRSDEVPLGGKGKVATCEFFTDYLRKRNQS